MSLWASCGLINVIDPGADLVTDLVTDYVFCGSSEDVVEQMLRTVSDEQPNRPAGGIEYASEDFIAEGCETRAL